MDHIWMTVITAIVLAFLLLFLCIGDIRTNKKFEKEDNANRTSPRKSTLPR